jgi:spore maturation protein CgeB
VSGRSGEDALGASPLRIVILGLSITSSWGNGHATTFRALVRELARRGHEVLFLERDVPWYAAHRDMPAPPWGGTGLYTSIEDLHARFTEEVRDADLVIVGSYVPEGTDVGEWAVRTARGPVAFYDIDTPVTVAAVERGDCTYLTRALIPKYDVYFSFTGGPMLDRIARELGARSTLPLYCSVDPELYAPQQLEPRWDLGYMGTYSEDRQPPLERLMLDAAREWGEGRFIVAGPQYPESVEWPANVERREHLPPAEHARFYNEQRFTLNITRRDMIAAGWSPSVRLFEAAACGVPVVSDGWDGLDEFFVPGTEILLSSGAADTLRALREVSEEERRQIGANARRRVLGGHTAAHRAAELEGYALALLGRSALSTMSVTAEAPAWPSR